MEDKTIIERHTIEDGKFNLANALLELENTVKINKIIIGELEQRVRKVEDGMEFFVDWFEKNQKDSIIIPTKKEIDLFKNK